jgi:hypothetical protein
MMSFLWSYLYSFYIVGYPYRFVNRHLCKTDGPKFVKSVSLVNNSSVFALKTSNANVFSSFCILPKNRADNIYRKMHYNNSFCIYICTNCRN